MWQIQAGSLSSLILARTFHVCLRLYFLAAHIMQRGSLSPICYFILKIERCFPILPGSRIQLLAKVRTVQVFILRFVLICLL